MIDAKEMSEITKKSICDVEDNKWKYIEKTIKCAAQCGDCEVEFGYVNDYQLNDKDVGKLRELGYAVEERYKNETSFIVRWERDK